jgi:DNA-binding MarR family transcriptional regulator
MQTAGDPSDMDRVAAARSNAQDRSMSNETDPAISTIETEIAMLLRRAEPARRSVDRPADALDRAAYLILRRLAEYGPQHVKAVADALGLDSPAVNRQVSAMERNGLVRRTRTPNGRPTLVEPTAAGLRRMTGVRAAREDLYTQVLATWSDGDRRTLAGLLTRLNHALAAHIGR